MKRITLKNLKEVAARCGLGKYDFVNPMLRDMKMHMDDYNDPKEFFDDFAYGGCQSGMIGMFIYNTDCRNFYVRHCESIEEFKEELEKEIGEPIANRNHLPHATFMCWLCYEETAHIIADALRDN